MLLLNGAGSSYHRRQLLGYLIRQRWEVDLCKHCPGRTAGGKKERKLSGGNLVYIVMRLCNRSDIGAQRHLVYLGEAHLLQRRLQIPRRNVISKLCQRTGKLEDLGFI